MTNGSAVVVDTDAFSLLYVRRDSSDPRIQDWRHRLTGRQVVVSFQTAAELLAGAIFDGWAERRMAHLRGILENTPTIVVDTAVIERCAALTASCRRDGHPLHQKHHTADRWVAACALAKDLALLAGDGICRGVPGLTLLA